MPDKKKKLKKVEKFVFVIGNLCVSRDDKDREGYMWINDAEGAGGEFKVSDFEKVISDFFYKNL